MTSPDGNFPSLSLAVIRALNRATNRDFAPSRMTFAHPRNSELREIHCILRCPVEFAQTTDSWVFPHRVMELPITSGDSQLAARRKEEGRPQVWPFRQCPWQ